MKFDKAKRLHDFTVELDNLVDVHLKDIADFLDSQMKLGDVLVVRQNDQTTHDVLVRTSTGGWQGMRAGFGAGTESSEAVVRRGYYRQVDRIEWL